MLTSSILGRSWGLFASGIVLALAACSSGGTTGTTASGTTTTTGTGGSTTTTTTATTTTTTTGTGGSGAGAPHGCQAYALSGDPDVVVDATFAPSNPGGIAWDGAHFAALTTGTVPTGFEVYLSVLSATGTLVNPPGQKPFGLLGADSTGGPIVAAGDREGALWSDRRTGDYEIFFALVKGAGVKTGDDVRVTSAQGLSLNPAIAFTGTEFLAVWQDDRAKDFHIFGQRISVDGALLGASVEITKPALGSTDVSPKIAVGPSNVGVVYISTTPGKQTVTFQLLGLDLALTAVPPITVEDAMGTPSAPVVAWDFDRYVIAWQDTMTPSKAIRAMAIGPDGATLVPPMEVTVPGAHASRGPQLLAMGDSLLLTYADDRDQNGGYELYARTLGLDLAPLSPELRVTSAMGDSLDPVIAAGAAAPFGDVGVLFRDDRVGGKQYTFFTRLVCTTKAP